VKLAIGVLARAPVAGRCKRRLLAAHEGGWVAGLCAAMLRDTVDGLLSVEASDYVVVASPLPADESGAMDFTTRAQAAVDVLARHVPAPWSVMPPTPRTPERPGDDRGVALHDTLLELLFDREAAVLVSADAPTAPVDPLGPALESLVAARTKHAAALLGPTDQGGAFLFATNRAVDMRLLHDLPWETPALAETIRLRCRDLGIALDELPPWYTVDEPSDVLRLLDELRKHPERAPRTAQFVVTSG
jgi:hypothetical protein